MDNLHCHNLFSRLFSGDVGHRDPSSGTSPIFHPVQTKSDRHHQECDRFIPENADRHAPESSRKNRREKGR
jgi:hypothetical protein